MHPNMGAMINPDNIQPADKNLQNLQNLQNAPGKNNARSDHYNTLNTLNDIQHGLTTSWKMCNTMKSIPDAIIDSGSSRFTKCTWQKQCQVRPLQHTEHIK
jgi:hypothetical protein